MLYIRTDASSAISSGHVMRCLAIALELRKEGFETTFLTTEKNAEEIIYKNKLPFIRIAGKWNDLEQEIDALIEIIKKKKIKKLLVDSYYASAKYFETLSQYTKLIYLGSLEKPFNSVRLLINYSNLYNQEFYETFYDKKKTRLLLGVQYAPLREEFRLIKPIVRDKVENILITAGSTDKENTLLFITKYFIEDEAFKHINFHLVVGHMNQNIEMLEELKRENNNVNLHFAVDSMAKLMYSCDIAISAGGTTLYELCACGVPTISFSLCAEQVLGAKKFAEDGIFYYAGDILSQKNKSLQAIQRHTKELIKSNYLRKKISNSMHEYIDGKGSERIIKAIKEL